MPSVCELRAFPASIFGRQFSSGVLNSSYTRTTRRPSKSLTRVAVRPLRHLGRTHGVSLAWLHEQTAVQGITVTHCDTAFQLADIFTKPYESVADWREKLKLISHVTFERGQDGRPRPLSFY